MTPSQWYKICLAQYCTLTPTKTNLTFPSPSYSVDMLFIGSATDIPSRWCWKVGLGKIVRQHPLTWNTLRTHPLAVFFTCSKLGSVRYEPMRKQFAITSTELQFAMGVGWGLGSWERVTSHDPRVPFKKWQPGKRIPSLHHRYVGYQVSSINSGIPVNDILVIYTPSMIYDIS